jgi:phosphatidylserine/phosphatidylglycerophosphate/cardiolipin synthase-like enzyme
MKQLRKLAWGLVYLALTLGAEFALADFRLEVAEAPTSNLNLTVNAIRSAKRSIFLNIYEFTSPEIAEAIVAQVQAGVHVEILEEGQPVGGLSPAAKGIQDQISRAMQEAGNGDRFYMMTSKAAAAKRRFRFDHAKYAVIDEHNLLIGSENYSPTGNPEPGTVGNRGWEVFIHDAEIAQSYKSIFQGDADMSHGDVTELTNNAIAPAIDKPAQEEIPENPDSSLPTAEPSLGKSLMAATIRKVSSPDSSLNGLLGLIRGAKTSLDIEQMSFDSKWSSGNNPLLAALEEAASRGVQIRVLLNDETVFFRGGKTRKLKNVETANYLNTLPNVEARIANVGAMGVDYVHNKGVLADGDLTLISSINWVENSILRNREAAVVIGGKEVFQHYEALFESDWNASASERLLLCDRRITSGNLPPTFSFVTPQWRQINHHCF